METASGSMKCDLSKTRPESAQRCNRLCTKKVTGPSFTSITSMSSPNRPGSWDASLGLSIIAKSSQRCAPNRQNEKVGM